MRVVNTSGTAQDITITHVETGAELTLQLQTGVQILPEGYGINAQRRTYYKNFLLGVEAAEDNRVVPLDGFALNGERKFASGPEQGSGNVEEPEAETLATTDDDEEAVDDEDADS